MERRGTGSVTKAMMLVEAPQDERSEASYFLSGDCLRDSGDAEDVVNLATTVSFKFRGRYAALGAKPPGARRSAS